jgi:hypothetical protein
LHEYAIVSNIRFDDLNDSEFASILVTKTELATFDNTADMIIQRTDIPPKNSASLSGDIRDKKADAIRRDIPYLSNEYAIMNDEMNTKMTGSKNEAQACSTWSRIVAPIGNLNAPSNDVNGIIANDVMNDGTGSVIHRIDPNIKTINEDFATLSAVSANNRSGKTRATAPANSTINSLNLPFILGLVKLRVAQKKNDSKTLGLML